MQTADNVAKWFLSRNELRFFGGDTEYITNLKLQKLLYYAQGMHLALYDKVLFDDPIVAWSYGPVVEAIYDRYSCNVNKGIEVFDTPIENFTKEEERTLQFTQDAFGQFSAWKLVDMTHAETPWQSTERNHVITIDKIQDYFKQYYVEEY